MSDVLVESTIRDMRQKARSLLGFNEEEAIWRLTRIMPFTVYPQAVRKATQPNESTNPSKGRQSRLNLVTRCSKCGNDDLKTILLQTRASDEPMTAFHECNQCGYKWKQ